jgi:hypothetical protein
METQPAQAATAAPTKGQAPAKGRGSDAAETTTIYFRVPLSAEHASKLQGDRTHPRSPASPHPAIPNQPQPRRQAHANTDRHRGPSPQAEAAPANRPKGSLRLRAIRFAKRFDDMKPSEARILIAIHRRTPRSLASESPAILKRDWQRFLLSTRGQRLSPQQTVPTIERIRGWVAAAKAKTAPPAVPAANSSEGAFSLRQSPQAGFDL